MSKIVVILLDLGNTLLYFNDSRPEVFASAQKAALPPLRASGLDIEADRFLQTFRAALEEYHSQRESDLIEHTTAHILRTVLADFGYPAIPDTTIQITLKAMYDLSQAHWIPEADALPTIQALRQEGYCLGVISNAADDADVQTLVDKARLRPYLDLIINSAAFGLRKPSPKIFQAALQHWNVPPSQTVMVGDNLKADIAGAQNAGIFGIWITRRASTPKNRPEPVIQPDATIATLAELPTLLKGLIPDTKV